MFNMLYRILTRSSALETARIAEECIARTTVINQLQVLERKATNALEGRTADHNMISGQGYTPANIYKENGRTVTLTMTESGLNWLLDFVVVGPSAANPQTIERLESVLGNLVEANRHLSSLEIDKTGITYVRVTMIATFARVSS